MYNILSQQKIICIGLRKKRAAPPPPTPRPLSSAMSTQALEHIVDSEESLTFDIEPTKPSTGVPSKTNSDIDCPKVNSDIEISVQSIHQLDCKLKSEITACESDCDVQQNCTDEANINGSKTDLVNSELVKAEVIALVEATPKVEQTRVAKRGKLAYIASNLNAFLCNSIPAAPQVGEGTNIDTEKTFHVTLYPRKYRFSGRDRLHAAIQNCHSQHDDSVSVNFMNDILVDIATKTQITDQLLRICQNSQSLKRIKSSLCQYCRGAISFHNYELLTNRSNKSNCDNSYTKVYDHISKHLARVQTSVNDIKSDMECEILKSTLNPKILHCGDYVCRSKYDKKDSSYSKNFRNNMTLRELKLSNSFENTNLTSSQNLCLRYSKTMNSLEFLSYSPKLGKISMTKCHTSSIVSCKNKKSYKCSKQYAENNLYPPPLSTLQIFAISTKPMDIQLESIKSVPNDINELSSLPIINYTENKLQERKLSILEPPPPGLVSRQESNESWNRFLVQLNSILENRIGEFV